MEQKRLVFLVFLLFVFTISPVIAFGGGGGGGSTTPTPTKPVAYIQQGGSVSITWSAPMEAIDPENPASKYSSANPQFLAIYISVKDPSGNTVASWTRTSNTGTLTWSVPQNAVVGAYSIENYAEYDDDVSQYSGVAYESSTQNNIFAVTAAPKTYTQGSSVPIGWTLSSSCESYNPTFGTCQTYRTAFLHLKVRDSQGNVVYSCDSSAVNGEYISGSCIYTIANNAPAGTYSISPDGGCENCMSFEFYDENTGKGTFNVVANTIPPGNNPGNPCGTGNTCNNGLTCQSGTCVQTNVNTGGQCDANRICTAGLVCSSGVCVNPNPVPSDQQAMGVVDGVYSDKYVRGWARDPDWQSAGQYISVQFYIDGTYAGSVIANSPSEAAVGGNGNHRFAWMVPQSYWNGQQHEVWGYAIGRTNTGSASGNNPQLGSPSYQSRLFTFQAPTVTCTDFTYSAWSTCSNGQQTRTVALSLPSGCTGGSPITSQSCTAGTGGVCSSNSHCTTGLTCTNNVCTDPTPQTHSECRNQQCTQVSGAGSNTCTLNTDCLRGAGGQCNNDYGCQAGLQCTSGICQTIPSQQLTSASWQNMNGALTTSGDKDDTLRMIGQGANLELNGGQIVFKVYKKQALIDSKVDEKTVTISSVGISSVNSTFKPTEAGTYYFKVSGGNSERTSGDVVIASSTSNSPPVAVITSPQSGGVYYTGSNIQFSHSSYDVDDTIQSVRWTFGDGSSDNSNSPSHSYSSSGQKTVTLEVTDSRGVKSTHKIDINLANQNGYTLFAVIEKPGNNAAIVSSNLVVEYSAKESYVINTVTTGSPCTVTVSCIQGQCPSTTRASPSCASNPNAQIPISGGVQGHTQIFFNWTFRDGNTQLSPENGMGKVSGTKGFSDYGIKNITVVAKYNLNGQNLQSVYTRGFTLFNQRQCSADGATWSKVENGLITETRDTLSTVACAGVDLQAGTGDDCCPFGFTCSTSGSVGCKTNSTIQNLGCASYGAQNSCNADASNRVRNELLWNYYSCGESAEGVNVLCSCAWNTQSGKCELQKSDRSDSNPIFGTLSQCTYTTQTSECVDGYQNVQIDATVLNGGQTPSCTDSTQILPCGKPVVALPFFTIINALIAIVAIIIVYYILTTIKSKNKRKK